MTPTRSTSFPFTSIVVTNPDQAAAEAAQKLLDATLAQQLKAKYPTQSIHIVSTYDPYGARCGSGGGTLAAVEKLFESKQKNTNNNNNNETTGTVETETETVLCLHAGGDSSRCPLCMILGKAWTSLPSTNVRTRNPTAWLIRQLELLYYHHSRASTVATNYNNNNRIPPTGCLWVAATDCLMYFFDDDDDDDDEGEGENKDDEDTVVVNAATQYDIPLIDPWSVLGVAVPAPVTTAMNHGVYVLPESSQQVSSSGGGSSSPVVEEIMVESPIKVWQKPTLEQLLLSTTSSPSASFDVPSKRSQEKQAWIDTGIVIFFPKAFETLLELSKGVLARCTWNGLKEAYRKEGFTSSSLTLEQFAKQHALKIDLYTDILHNLSWHGKPNDVDSNDSMSSSDGMPKSVSSALHQALSKLPLKILLVPMGIFLHLGTTRELINFITNGAHANSLEEETATKVVGSALHLQSRCQSLVNTSSNNEGSGSSSSNDEKAHNVAHCCIFPLASSTTTLIGNSSFVEYCNFAGYRSVVIGDDCMVSGWRRLFRDGDENCTTAPSLDIPNHLSVQQLALRGNDRFVYMVLGTDDSIKNTIRDATLYGVSFSDVVARSGLSLTDIGLNSELGNPKDCLWTAKIHPIVSLSKTESGETPSFSSLFHWIALLRDGACVAEIRNDPSFMAWVSSERVSLKELHGIADASVEWDYRNALEDKVFQLKLELFISNTASLLRERCQDQPCDNLQWIIDIPDRMIARKYITCFVIAMEEVALSELECGNYDISGRALMLASSILADLSGILGTESDVKENVVAECRSLLNQLKLSSTQPMAMNEKVELVHSVLILNRSCLGAENEQSLTSSSEILELLALCMVEFTISDGFRRFLQPNNNANGAEIQFTRIQSSVADKWAIATAPVRVDLAGGWSDTPPICYEYGGSVTGMSILVDNFFPIACRCRIVSGKIGIHLRSEIREISTGVLSLCQQVEVHESIHLYDFRNPTSECALTKVCLVCLGIATEAQLRSNKDLQTFLNEFCGSTSNVRLEVVTTSLLGMGSGMGTSSILAACILSAIAKCVGIGEIEHELLIHTVLMVEQLLSSGGGWQDQAHGILPGVKTVRSQPPRIPLEVHSEYLDIRNEQMETIEKRFVFAFTGKTRLAKNILQQVLRRWSRRTHEIVQTVEGLVDASERLREAYLQGQWDVFASCMDESFRLKCVMAGEGSGAEPEPVKILIRELKSRDLVKGAMLCGAGGGGFLLLIASEGIGRESIEEHCVDRQFDDFRFHDCSIARQGLTTSFLDDEMLSMESYALSWQLA